jgi:hypothetical protein
MKWNRGAWMRCRRTSAALRKEAIAQQTGQQAVNEFSMPLKPLLDFEGVTRNGFQRSILLRFEDYL